MMEENKTNLENNNVTPVAPAMETPVAPVEPAAPAMEAPVEPTPVTPSMPNSVQPSAPVVEEAPRPLLEEKVEPALAVNPAPEAKEVKKVGKKGQIIGTTIIGIITLLIVIWFFKRYFIG